MEVCSYLPFAHGKVSFFKRNLKEADGEVPVLGTRTLSGIDNPHKVANGRCAVDGAGIWNEAYCPELDLII